LENPAHEVKRMKKDDDLYEDFIYMNKKAGT